jgi:hypothetical protein
VKVPLGGPAASEDHTPTEDDALEAGGHGEKLSRVQEQAIGALLTEKTLDAAAARAGVSTSSLKRWMREEPDFVAGLRAARRAIVEAVIGRAQSAACEALDCLCRNLTAGPPAVQVAAAKELLSQAIKGIELVDVVERLELIERTLKERGKL